MKKPLSSLRAEFPHARRAVFFDHANFGPCPKRARRLLDQLAGRFQALDPRVDRESFALLAHIKRDFARLIGARGNQISFIPNTTTGINQVLLGLDLKPGERILLPEVEFPALVYPIQYLAQRNRLQLEFLPCPEGFLPLEILRRALARRRTALVAASWVQYFNGYRYDAAELAALCHRYEAFLLLDGTQGVGAAALNVTQACVDALACGGSKWLFCQTGSGFLYLNPQPVREVQPAIIGWLSADWGYTFGDLQRHDRPLYADGRRFEWGTYPYYSLRLAQVGLELVNAAGPRRTFRHVDSLLDELAAFLQETPYTITSVRDPRHRSAILCFTGPRIARLHPFLRDQHIRVSLRENSIRVSPHFYNTRQEMGRFIAAIRRFLS